LGKEFKYDSLLNLWQGVNMSTIKVAIAGVGNCASSLVQGVEFYKDVDEKSGFIPGIAHNIIGHYRIRDIQFVAAFDVDKNKVGKDLSEAIFTSPNCAMKF
jgi:myo-inositol-1-phosphate synthase